jgi:YhcN/YlaJ family sporulation lipoprotein
MKIWYIIALMLLVSGCNGGNQNNVAQNSNQDQHIVKVKNSNIPEVDRKTGQDIAKHLVNLTTSLPNVNDATAVVLGPFAIVGIDVNENVERSQVGSIKYTVAESLKNDPHGARAVVVADPDLTARLKEVQEDIKNGKPIQGIMNELADISGRLIPEIPADIIDKNTKKGVEDPKKQLNQNERQKLENKQDEQSNYHK